MKVELQCGNTITIPDGCKAVIEERSPMNGGISLMTSDSRTSVWIGIFLSQHV